MSCETNRQRTGRPPDVPNDVMLKTRLKLAESKTGWDFSQVMDVIYTKTGRRYHELDIYTDYYRIGDSNPRYQFKKEQTIFSKTEGSIGI